MREFLFIALGSAGDVHPFVGIGAALRRRGHRVAVITNNYFEDLIRREGLDFIEFGSREVFLRTLQDPRLWHPHRSFRLIYEELVLNELRPLYQLIREHTKDGQTVVVASVLAMSARIAHEKLGIPLVSLHLQPGVFRSLIDPPVLPGLTIPSWFPRAAIRGLYRAVDWYADRMVAPEINRFRKELGLASPVSGIIDQWWHSPQRVIGLFPSWYASPPPDWPAQVQLTGFPLYDASSLDPVPPELDSFLASGPPPVVFTPGSAMSQGAFFFKESAEACRLLGCRGILITKFPSQLPRGLPPGVQHFSYVPFSRLLPRSAAFVHHGGIGTTAQALAGGVPQLIMPLAYDQPDNAARVVRLGVGLKIKPSAYKARRVADLLKRLMAPSSFSQAALAARERFRGVDSIGQTCELLENLA